jgi:hypothetical protein
MTRDALLCKLRTLEACTAAIEWLKSTDHATLQSAWDACEKPDWMLWLLHRLGADKKIMVTLACDCAETSLHLYAKRYPDDDRPANAIRVARVFANGTATIQEVNQARKAAAAADPAAAAAAAAAYAVSAAAADAAAYAVFAAVFAADAAADAVFAAAADAARAKANKHMAALVRKRVPNPEDIK